MKFDAVGREIVSTSWLAIEDIPDTVLDLAALLDPGSNQILGWNESSNAIEYIAVPLNQLSDVVITGPTTGDILQFDGADWVNAALTSLDISDFDEAVDDRVATLLVAGTNITLLYNDVANTLTISSAGTSSPLTTKGDIYVFSTVNDRLAVGANGQVLSADSTEATGLKWIDAPSGSGGGGTGVVSALEFVGEAVVTGAAATTLTLSGLDLDAHEAYFVSVELDNATGSTASISMFFDGDTTATNYDVQAWVGFGTTTAAARANNAIAFTLAANNPLSAVGWLRRNVEGNARFLYEAVREKTTTIDRFSGGHAWRTVSNVTSITLSSSVASALAIGSTLKVWKLRTVFSSGDNGTDSALEFVGESVLGADGTTLTISGLDLDSDEQYHLEMMVENATASTLGCSLYYNGDTTATNYDRQTLVVNGASVTGSRANDAGIGGSVANGTTNFSTCQMIRRDFDGKPRCLLSVNRDITTSLLFQHTQHMWRTSANVTSISIVTTVNMSAGSFIRVWRLRKVSGGDVVDPARGINMLFDFEHPLPAGNGDSPFTTTVSGTGATVSKVSTAGHVGVWNLVTGTTTTGRAAFSQNFNASAVEGGQPFTLDTDALIIDALIRIDTVPDGTNTFEFRVGLADAGVSFTNAVQAQMVWTGSATRWRLLSRAASSDTTADASFGPTSATWHLATIVVTSSLIQLYIDDPNRTGSVAAQISTGIPTASLGLIGSIQKSAGTSSRTGDVDLIRVRKTFTTPRF